MLTHRFAFPCRFLPVLTVLAVLWLDVAAAQGRPNPVVVDPVRREQLVDRRLVTGEIRALRESRVAAREPGLVVRVAAREGETVEEGALLAQLDDSRLQLELAVIEASRRVAEVTVEERRVALEQAARDLESLTRLSERGAANPKELADAKTAHLAARTRVAQAEASVQETARRGDLLRRRIADMQIKAPFKGIVVSKHKDAGDWVATGEGVYDLISVGPVEAWLDVPQQIYAFALVSRLPVTVQVESLGESVETKNLRVVPRVDPNARSFPLIARIENEKAVVTPGMSVTAWVPTGGTAERLTVSKDALLRGDTGTFLYVARGGAKDRPATAFPVLVRTLFSVGDRVAIEALGLRAGEMVIVEGNERLFPMTPVIPMPRAAGGAPAGKKAGAAPKAAGPRSGAAKQGGK